MTNENLTNSSLNSANTTSPDSNELDGIADIEKYFLHSKGEIAQKLRLLEKSKSSITGYFNNGNEFFLTAIVDVIRDKNILVLDISNNKELNDKVLKSEHIVFKAKHLGITAQFNTKNMQTAKLKGQRFFACPLPEDLLWVQRRQYFRVRIPLCDNALFQITKEVGELKEYRIIDVSAGGIAIADETFELQVEAGDELHDSNLIFEDNLSTTTNLTIQNTLPLDFNNPDAGQRIGCMFQGLKSDFAAELQKYINALDSHYRKTLDD